MDADLRHAIATLQRKGVKLFAPIPWPDNDAGYEMSGTDEVAAFLASPDDFEARINRVSVDQLRGFRAVRGRVTCSGTNKDGSPCKRALHWELYPDEWVKASKKFRCNVHSLAVVADRE